MFSGRSGIYPDANKLRIHPSETRYRSLPVYPSNLIDQSPTAVFDRNCLTVLRPRMPKSYEVAAWFGHSANLCPKLSLKVDPLVVPVRLPTVRLVARQPRTIGRISNHGVE